MSTDRTGSEPGKTGAEAPPSGHFTEDIAVLREESREQLELLRTLVRLLLPKADDDGPKLEDLLAALIAQQRDILLAIRQVQSDIEAVLERLDDDPSHDGGSSHVNGNGSANGAAPA
ncbi:hypothetical protein ACELLULO517_22620 [Acidisoma cellulosilytica]|uniref:Uncharacterized protein n=1 Tax=Acidisoma cellulosilyticum TaxID=2802395 RepID=A0A963Z556_9PROT|nr:hypothetical protein [Acidisoma cellulosilyticum]MCB8883060.1 hypothetical protein [Acidisoma cellulosilyticum]